MPVMAYSPLGGPDSRLLRDPTRARIGAAHDCSAAAVALAWIIRSGTVIAIPESGSAAHVKENAEALSLTLAPQELQTLDPGSPGFGIAYPETHPPEIRSGGCSILHVEAKVLYATGELGNRPGRISLDEIVGAEILIEGAVFQHVVDGREN